MPFWKKKKPKWKTYTHKQWASKVLAMKEYRGLCQALGKEWADEFVDLIERMMTGGGNSLAQHWNEEKDKVAYWSTIGKFMQGEMTRFLAGHYRVGALKVSASTGSLRRGLSDGAMEPRDYGANENDTEVLKAAKWLCNESTSLKNAGDDAPVNLSKVHSALRTVVEGKDVLDLETLIWLHDRVYHDPTGRKTSRNPGMDASVNYCSSVGGKALLEKTFTIGNGLKSVTNGDAKWEDNACFLLGSIIRSHGFVDGNGRAGRGLYACTLIQGGRNFVPATYGKVKELTQL